MDVVSVAVLTAAVQIPLAAWVAEAAEVVVAVGSEEGEEKTVR